MNSFYVLVELDIIINNKTVIGIYTYDAGLKEISLRNNTSLGKIYDLEGPFIVKGLYNRYIIPEVPQFP